MNTTAKTSIGIVVALGIAVVIWLGAPLFYDKEVNESLPTGGSAPTGNPAVLPTAQDVPVQGEPVQPALSVLGEGSFQGFDQLHQASGTARIVEVDGKKYVRFEEDFEVTNGPDLFVYFGRNGEYVDETNLGRLKGNKGSQNYEIPASINVDDFSEVWVWCRAFSVPFGRAVLQ